MPDASETAATADPSAGSAASTPPASPAPPATPSATAPAQGIDRVGLWPKVLFILGILIFIINMSIAWTLTMRASSQISQPLVSENGPDKTVMQAMQLLKRADGNDHIFAQQLLSLDATLRTISNRHIILIVAMASSFSLIAIGFALFVMGIESAYTFSAGDEHKGGLVLKATAPGLSCFLFAAAIIITTISCQTTIHTGSIAAFNGNRDALPSESDGPVPVTQPALKPISDDALKAFLQDPTPPKP